MTTLNWSRSTYSTACVSSNRCEPCRALSSLLSNSRRLTSPVRASCEAWYELPLHAPFAADIAEHHDRADHVADTVTDRCRRVLYRYFLTTTSDQDRIFGKRYDAAFFQTPHNRVFHGRARMLVYDHHNFGDVLVSCAAQLPPGEILRNGIHVIDIAIGVRCNDAVTDRLQRYLRTFLLFEDPGFGAFAIGDIGNRAFVRREAARPVVDRPRILENDNLATILASQPVFEVLDDAVSLQAREYPVPVDRVGVQHLHANSLEIIDAVVSQHLHQRAVRRDDLAGARRNVNAVDDVFEQAAISRLAAAPPQLVLLAFYGNTDEARHAAQLTELFSGRRATFAEIHVHRAKYPIGCAVDDK